MVCGEPVPARTEGCVRHGGRFTGFLSFICFQEDADTSVNTVSCVSARNEVSLGRVNVKYAAG